MWFWYNDENIGQGRENTSTFLKENLEVAKEISLKIRSLEQIQLLCIMNREQGSESTIHFSKMRRCTVLYLLRVHFPSFCSCICSF